MTSTIERILSQLSHKPAGDGKWQAKCPAHEDKTASLTISQGRDGTILLHCHAGCDTALVCESLGVTVKDLFPANNLAGGDDGGEITYDYYDEDGVLLMQAVRRPGKKFLQRKPDGSGGWEYKLGDARRVLYRLPELSSCNGLVFICEGEKDVDNLLAIGLTATCNIGGAGKWRKKYNKHFRGRKVIILPDNDDPGQKHALQVAESLLAVTETIKIVDLPDLAIKGDVSDWLAAGGTRDELLQIVRAAPKFVQTAQRSAGGESSKTPLFEFTDVGNGQRFAAEFGDRLRFCYSMGCWLVWDGKRWDMQRGDAASRLLAAEMVQNMQAAGLQGNQAIKSWGRECQKSSRISAILLEAKGRLAVYSDDLDTDSWVLNCDNGVLDLRTGKLGPHEPGLLMTKLCPVAYDLEADLSEWAKFLGVVLQDDFTTINFLCNAVGYSLTGSTREEKLFFVHGPGAAGKSTFIEAVKATLGDYAKTSDFETFATKPAGSDGARNDIARLQSSRFVASIEIEDGKRLAEGLVKTITGSDTITARYLYREAFEFRPEFKLWICANHAPKVKQDDDAIWRRILRIPFEHVIPVDKRNPKVKERLTDVAISGPAILRWAVEGCRQWQEHGLEVPETVTAATDAYRRDMDPLADWIEDNCELVPDHRTPVTVLQTDYQDWARDNGVKFTVGRKTFNDRLKAMGMTYKSARYGLNPHPCKCWVGVKLNSDNHLQLD